MTTCIFGERKGDKVIEKGTLVKMARGEMVRFLAENSVKDLAGFKGFNRLGYVFEESLSDVRKLVFVKKAASEKG